MKTYTELTEEQQAQAVEKCRVHILRGICEGILRFNDGLNGDDLQARIDKAFEKAERMQTPWFAHEYIMDTCAEEIEGMARADAEDSLYSEGENVIRGIL